MAQPKPDFRNMTPQQIRENISRLNREVCDLRKMTNQAGAKFAAGQLITMGAGIPATLAFPPLGLGILAAGTVHGMEKSIEASTLNAHLKQAESLRDQFKTVWRARPGRKFYDIDARVKRENKRRADARHKKMLKEAQRKYGRFGIKFD